MNALSKYHSLALQLKIMCTGLRLVLVRKNKVGSGKEEDIVLHTACCKWLAFFLKSITVMKGLPCFLSQLLPPPDQCLPSIWSLKSCKRCSDACYPKCTSAYGCMSYLPTDHLQHVRNHKKSCTKYGELKNHAKSGSLKYIISKKKKLFNSLYLGITEEIWKVVHA